ncbi:uncharacterized protein ACNS7B_024252 [Menidia menidia]
MKQVCTIGEKRSCEGERSLIGERRSSDALRFTSNNDSARNGERAPNEGDNTPHNLDRSENDTELSPASRNAKDLTESKCEKMQAGDCVAEGCGMFAAQETRGEEDQRQPAKDKASSDATSLNSDSSEKTGNAKTMDKAEKKDSAKTRRSTRQANRSSVEALAGKPDPEDQPQSESDTKETVKTPSRRGRKKGAIRKPTRSSLRSRKKVRETKPRRAVKGKKEPSKKQICLYCKLTFTQLAKHLEKKHAGEADVAHALHFPKGSRVRHTLLDQIRKKDEEPNCQVLKSGDGEEVADKKQANNPTVPVRDFLPCQHCFAFYRKTDLWRHERSCKLQKGDQKTPENPKRTRNCTASSQLLPMSEYLTGSCEEIIHIMHQDDISKHIMIDPLICKYGNTLSVKYDHDKSQFAYIGQKMRELGRFVLAVHELDQSVKYLHEICQPSRFELAVEGVKKVSGFDPSSSKFKTISLVSKIGYSLKRAAEIAFGESRMTEDSETESELKTFIHLLDTKWSECFSRKTLAHSLKQEIKKVEVDKSTVTEDLIKLHRFITGEEDEARKELKDSPSMSTWKKLSEATLADVCLFNRGRVGNIGRLLLQTYVQRKSRGTFTPSADHVRKSTKLELELGSSFTRLELEGQYGRNMLVLLTERMVLSIDLLVEHREQAGVSKTNPYLFARTEGPSFIRGLDCFRRAAVECGVKNPDALLSSSLREQIASCWQLMSLGEPELDQVAKLLERSCQECYGLSQNASQLEEVTKQLLKIDRSLPSSPPSTAKNGAGQKSALKRKPWSAMEQAAVKRYLSEFITKMKVPGKKECNACIAAEPDLGGRSWTDVKNYVHNTLQTVRRRNNHHKPEKNGKASNPKSPKAAVQTAKAEVEDTIDVCTMTTVNPEHLSESPDCCMAMGPTSNLNDSSPFSQEMGASYASLCFPNTDMVHSNQSLMSTFTPLNATDTQVVPTFTPLNTTTALMPPVYTSENNQSLSISSLYTQNPTSMLPPSLYSPHDATNSPLIPSFTTFNAPSTSMVPTYTQLNTPGAPMVSAFSTLNERSPPSMSSFTPLNHSSPPPYHSSSPSIPTAAQVVPSIHGPPRESSPESSTGRQATPGGKPQKRNKRLWNEEEQAAVRRQLGDFCKLVKVPGKKDCDACLAAEPALGSRTWREVKYFVHNSIQSLKRRGHVVACKQSLPPEPEALTPNAEWDAPVYLSL